MFLVIATDRDGVEALRSEHREAHVAYLKKQHYKVRIEAGGPLIEDQKTQGAGTFLLVTAADRTAVEDFVRSDPFALADVFGSIQIRPCRVTLRATAA